MDPEHYPIFRWQKLQYCDDKTNHFPSGDEKQCCQTHVRDVQPQHWCIFYFIYSVAANKKPTPETKSDLTEPKRLITILAL